MRLLTYTVVWFAVALPPASADEVRAAHVAVELVAENQSLVAGSENWLGLRIAPEAGWHVYWRNPGDSGLPTTLDWNLPAGVTAGPLQWPYPHREVLGDLVNYGYDRQTLLPVALHLPADWPAGQPLTARAKARWLVCKDVCIPGSAELSLTLPVLPAGAEPQADPRTQPAFAQARAELPQPPPANWQMRFAVHRGDFTLGVSGAQLSGEEFEFFPYASDLVQHSAPQRVHNDPAGELRITQQLNEAFVKAPAQVDGVLVVHNGEAAKAWEIHAQPGAVAPVPLSAAQKTAAAPAPAASVGLWLALSGALLGGLILNLMPCVFPVLSIKSVSLIEARGAVARRQRAHALFYTAGVLTTFAALGGVLLALRQAGTAVGWGFQLQQPVFVAALAYLMFAMALSLSGVVQFGVRLMGVGQSLAASGGYRGSFFTGVLAVLVATPCTAPFMGTALGYALAQPAAVALAVFLALGLGMALPFLLLGYFPRLGAWLPKPGAWMETFKQAMAFPLYLSVAWLLWVLGGLTSRDGMALAAVGLVLLAFALWLWPRRSAFAAALKFAALAAAVALLAAPQLRAGSAAAAPLAAAAHERFTPQRLEELRSQGRTVFVNFTADWCITCKLNERVALDSETVRAAFAAHDVVWLEGDWTRENPAITAMLQQFGRSGVPLYLLYPKGGAPVVLPQLLTPSILVDALPAS
jgi:thiol:disulfide interchange protein